MLNDSRLKKSDVLGAAVGTFLSVAFYGFLVAVFLLRPFASFVWENPFWILIIVLLSGIWLEGLLESGAGRPGPG